MPTSNNDEQQLIERLKDPKTQRRAFEQLVGMYGERMYWQIRRMVLTHEDANDVLQNVMMKAWMHLDSFHQDSKLSTWLYRIAVNESLDFLRRQQAQKAMSTDDDASGVANMLMADNYFDGDETAAQLQEAIARLPEVQRTVFNLRYFENLKYSEISQIMHTTEGALKASYHLAVKKVTDFFNNHD